ncbi:MAG: transcriptional regulator, AsnC family [Chloroflexi bacterium]|nr:transcriptional regulator, AsnC family [Chloroflexota bacterium]
MDDLDYAILSLLQRDGRKPYTEIAQVLGVSEGTVRNRVYRLLEEQVIQIVGQVDPYHLGFDAPAIMGVSVHPTLVESAAEQIAAFPETSYLLMVSGAYDLIVEVVCRDREHLANFLNHSLRKVEGVQNIHTFLILRTLKADYEIRPKIEENP